MSNETRKLWETVDGARLVETRQDWALAFVWKGGHGVNVYDLDTGVEVDFFNVGNFADNAATEAEVHDGIEDYLDWTERETVEHVMNPNG